VALDPLQVVRDIADRSHRLDAVSPPGMLTRPVAGGEPLPHVRGDDQLTELHAAWARADGQAPGGLPPDDDGLRGRFRARVAATSGALASPAQRDDRALIGALIRAVDALARRCDELADKVADLESVLAEIVDTVGSDLVAIRAALSAGPPAGSPPGGPQPPEPPPGAPSPDG
jgi:hypothetical protein